MSPASITITSLREKKASGGKITMLTAYDYSMASLLDSCGVDVILVGDSLAMVALGYDSTVPVTVDQMLHHCAAVQRGAHNTLIVGDMPFMSYQVSAEKAVENGARFLKEGGCHGVKLEGGIEIAPTIRRMVKAGIPVMGHIGLTPQTAQSLGGFKVQGKDIESASRLLDSAKALDEAGVFGLVLECIPSEIAHVITDSISAPTIGIGAGPFCDGQVLVTNDMIGLFEKFTPKFVKQYLNLAPAIRKAINTYVNEVRGGSFPAEEHGFSASQEVVEGISKGRTGD